ncbi:C6 transcription factor [Penicillium chermesinum]|uniref:C6 transcription factor n=1 Tax=Penicillium chermesinum TaxID=63820 RepID=A0A9W9TSD5_9EURO|nr:C6 transcription factor [Penicillium chermesinum]KAJ5239422.1 C6 transcription factor [Penicillium chermesinum]
MFDHPREIHRLRSTIQELETRLKSRQADHLQSLTEIPPPLSKQSGSVSHPHGLPGTGSEVNQSKIPSSIEWTGVQIQIHHDQTAEATYYGPLSSAYFGHRMQKFLIDSLGGSPVQNSLAEATLLERPPNIAHWQSRSKPSTDEILCTRPEKLSHTQENYFIDLFWQSFHCIYPITLEAEFRNFYDSVWAQTNDQTTRQSSPLVDSLLALCIQLGSAFLTSDASANGFEMLTGHIESALETAHYYFRRCQIDLLDEMECPSIMTLQSQIYSVVYLVNLSCFNAGHAALGAAVKTAQALKLHPRSSQSTVQAQQELHIRIWHTLLALDRELSMTLGEVRLSQSKMPRPTSLEMDMSMRWSPAHAVQTSFYQQAIQKLEQRNGESIYEHPALVEELAGCLGREVRIIYDWARNVPQSLKCFRKGSGEAFSTERTALDLDSFSPLWLQRQKVLLEVLYHHVQLSNLRSFLRFPPGSCSITPLSDCHSINCLNHAIILTNILHQVLSETDILRGWPSILHYQWDAALCIIGFVLANPVCPPTPAARKSIQTAIASFEFMGRYLAAATKAAQIVREVGAQAELLVERFHSSLSTRPPPESRRLATSAAVQVKAAPALTPEYLQGLTVDAEFDISEFISDAGLPAGDAGDHVTLSESTLATAVDDMQAGTAMSWMNDPMILENLGLFAG